MGKLSDVELRAWIRHGKRVAGKSDGDGLTFTVHDLRRTSRSLMADIGVPFDVAEKILGHKLPGVAHVYDRGGSKEQQRAAMAKVALKIVGLESNAPTTNVVGIERGNHLDA